MTLKNKIWSVAKYLPGVSFANLNLEEDKNKRTPARFGLNLAYFVIPVASIFVWADGYAHTRKFNPINQFTALNQRRIERKNKQKEFDEYHKWNYLGGVFALSILGSGIPLIYSTIMFSALYDRAHPRGQKKEGKK